MRRSRSGFPATESVRRLRIVSQAARGGDGLHHWIYESISFGLVALLVSASPELLITTAHEMRGRACVEWMPTIIFYQLRRSISRPGST